ncbi:hypothetical protein ACHAQA_005741 [Verticillium albo-atrum]
MFAINSELYPEQVERYRSGNSRDVNWEDPDAVVAHWEMRLALVKQALAGDFTDEDWKLIECVACQEPPPSNLDYKCTPSSMRNYRRLALTPPEDVPDALLVVLCIQSDRGCLPGPLLKSEEIVERRNRIGRKLGLPDETYDDDGLDDQNVPARQTRVGRAGRTIGVLSEDASNNYPADTTAQEGSHGHHNHGEGVFTGPANPNMGGVNQENNTLLSLESRCLALEDLIDKAEKKMKRLEEAMEEILGRR